MISSWWIVHCFWWFLEKSLKLPYRPLPKTQSTEKLPRLKGSVRYEPASSSTLADVLSQKDVVQIEPSWLVVWNINFIFPYIGNNHPNWLIFFRGVQTTNQLLSIPLWCIPSFCRKACAWFSTCQDEPNWQVLMSELRACLITPPGCQLVQIQHPGCGCETAPIRKCLGLPLSYAIRVWCDWFENPSEADAKIIIWHVGGWSSWVYPGCGRFDVLSIHGAIWIADGDLWSGWELDLSAAQVNNTMKSLRFLCTQRSLMKFPPSEEPFVLRLS